MQIQKIGRDLIHQTNKQMKTITANTVLSTRLIVDSEIKLTCKILKRSKNTCIVLFENQIKRVKIYNNNGEFIMPAGKFSMAPVFNAE